MPVDYRTLKAGFYWVRWKGEVMVAEWKARDDHWMEGLLGGWAAGLLGEDARLCHVWDDDAVLNVECLAGPLVPPGEAATFEEVWARKEREGYQYGSDALEQVRFGWELARGVSVPAATPTVRFVNHTRHRLGVQVLPAGAVGGAPDRITLIVEDEVETPV